MMNKQKGDGAETPVTPGDARSWVGDLRSLPFHTRVGGFGKLSTACAVLSVNLQLFQSKADWGGKRPRSVWLSQGTLSCVWSLGRASPQVRREHPRPRSPGSRNAITWLFGIFRDWNAAHVHVPQILLGSSKGITDSGFHKPFPSR